MYKRQEKGVTTVKSKIWILIFTVMFFLTGCSFDKNEKIAYFNDETNYIIDEGKIVKIILLDDPSKYSNAYETLLEIDLGENPKYMPHPFGGSIGRFYIVTLFLICYLLVGLVQCLTRSASSAVLPSFHLSSVPTRYPVILLILSNLI